MWHPNWVKIYHPKDLELLRELAVHCATISMAECRQLVGLMREEQAKNVGNAIISMAFRKSMRGLTPTARLHARCIMKEAGTCDPATGRRNVGS